MSYVPSMGRAGTFSKICLSSHCYIFGQFIIYQSSSFKFYSLLHTYIRPRHLWSLCACWLYFSDRLMFWDNKKIIYHIFHPICLSVLLIGEENDTINMGAKKHDSRSLCSARITSSSGALWPLTTQFFKP